MRGITFETMAHALMSTAYNRDGIASRSSGHLKASAPPSRFYLLAQKSCFYPTSG
ncbi:hypothetical protein KBI23_13790 [bacterium]|nr:hypothetical protein [bacterium]MBP9811208.1 hypothetical protein [bacterium]